MAISIHFQNEILYFDQILQLEECKMLDELHLIKDEFLNNNRQKLLFTIITMFIYINYHISGLVI